MADPEIRTLPDGYQVYYYEPDERHPKGKMVLVPGQSRLRERLEAKLHHRKAAHREIHDQRRTALNAKQAAERAKGVPRDKCFV